MVLRSKIIIFLSTYLATAIVLGYPNAVYSDSIQFQEELMSDEPIIPIPLNIELDERKVALGEKLFHDTRLSKDNTISCSHCHGLDTAGVDKLKFSFGIDGQEGPINSPTVYNSGFSFRQFWDGRAATLEEQAEGPIHAAAEMGSSWEEVLGKLKKDKRLEKEFMKIYGEGAKPEFIQDAIATFERSLITPNSPMDKYLRGSEDALTKDEKEGYALFKDLGCISCHQGQNIGGNMYHTMGAIGDYFKDRGNITKADLGRYNVTGLEEHKHRFKVPTLRNVALTAPYFHDGSVNELEKAVETMAKYQLGIILTETETSKIVSFLKALTGEYKGKILE